MLSNFLTIPLKFLIKDYIVAENNFNLYGWSSGVLECWGIGVVEC